MNHPAPPLTEPQVAAFAKLACGLEGGGVAVLCGPPGVGKTTVLEHLAADPPVAGRSSAVQEAAAWLEGGDLPDVVLADDAHLATAADLARLLARCRRRPTTALVLSGEGRLLTLLARDPRLAQAIRIQAALLPGCLADTQELIGRATGTAFDDRVAAAIHEITGGVPADVLRLAGLASVVAADRPDRGLTTADIEAIHRRLAPRAA